MWKTFVFDENYYLFQFIYHNNEIIINLSNLQAVWMLTISLNDLITKFKEMNQLLTQEPDDLRKSCLETINEQFVESLTFFNDKESCQIEFKHLFEELPLKMTINLTKQIGDEFLQKVTVPIIQTLQYLELKQKKLEKLLQQKDKELDEYKLEFENISKKYLTTAKYEPDTEVKPSLLLNTFVENQDFNTKFALKHGDVQQLFPEVKLEEKREKRKLELAPIKSKKFK